jgi:hypothetical protein
MGVTSKEVLLAMVTGGELESNLNSQSSGGGAYGVWQLQGNPRGADTSYAASVMIPRYEQAVTKVPASEWQSNPEEAAEEAAYLAERPAETYFAAQGAKRVAQAYSEAASAVNGTSPPGILDQLGNLVTGSNPGGFFAGLNPITDLNNAGKALSSTVGQDISTLLGPLTTKAWWLRVGEFLAGLLLCIIGLFWLFHRDAGNLIGALA